MKDWERKELEEDLSRSFGIVEFCEVLQACWALASNDGPARPFSLESLGRGLAPSAEIRAITLFPLFKSRGKIKELKGGFCSIRLGKSRKDPPKQMGGG